MTEIEYAARAIAHADGNDWFIMSMTYNGRQQCHCYSVQAEAAIQAYKKFNHAADHASPIAVDLECSIATTASQSYRKWFGVTAKAKQSSYAG